MEKKRTWKKSIKFFNLTGTKTKPPVLPDERLDFNETQKFIQQERKKLLPKT